MNNPMYGGQQNYYYGNGFGPAQQYAAARKPRFTNPLSEEQKKMLKASPEGFSLFVSDKEMTKAFCTHKDGDQISLYDNPDGSKTCWICGKTFNLVDYDMEKAKQVTADFVDLSESIKTYYLDMPENVAKEFFQKQPFDEKTPELYGLALKNFTSYENPMTNPMNQGNNYFGFYDNISNPGYMFNPAYGYPQQNMAYGMPQQNYAPQGYVNPMMPNGAQPVGGFGYVDNGMNPGMAPAQPMMNQAPQAAPQQTATPVSPIPQPGTPNMTPADTVTQNKTFSL